MAVAETYRFTADKDPISSAKERTVPSSKLVPGSDGATGIASTDPKKLN